MGDIGKRIESARTAARLSQAELASRVGVSRFQVIKWESGRDEPSAHRFPAIGKALNVSTDWLLTGHGAKLQSPPLTYEKLTAPKELEPLEMPQMHKLPVVESIAANHLPTFTEAKDTEFVNIKYSRANHYCLRVKGQSMKPMIYEGDIVIVEKVYYHLDELLEEVGNADKKFWKGMHKKVVCASVDDDDPVLKRMRVQDRKDTDFKIWLAGDNPSSEQIEINRDSRLKIFGIVKQIMRDPANYEG